MKSLFQILSEGNIGDLKSVRYIRHYTTLRGIKDIIDSGYIKAHRSMGDADWEHFGYDFGEEKVVSFHDSRTDPEIEFIKNANDNKTNLKRTETLGIHLNEICAFIEYNFDLLPENIQKKADFIKILENIVPDFCSFWNKYVCSLLEKCPDINKFKTLDEFIEFLPTNDNSHIKDMILSSSDKNKILKLLKRKTLSKFTSSDKKDLLNAAIKDDKKLVFSILKSHGFEPKDIENPYIDKVSEWTRVNYHDTFMDYIQKRFLKTNPKQIECEIRIACDMPINIKGCTIYFFKGMADKVEEIGDGAIPGYIDFLKQLTLMPNVEIYESGDDYSLIN